MQILFMRQDCGGCGGDVPIWSDVCGRCGFVLHSPRRLRAAGVLYVVLGLILAVPMAYLIAVMAGIIARSDDPLSRTRFTGSTWDAVFAFGILGLVLAVGVLGIVMGVWQIRHGRRNLKLVRIAMVCYLAFWVGATLIVYLG
ncbi:MAG TPA: hypothetical protein VGR37_20490 [Longimicrobiaceae bacterium]|nr:hypothetical protein [Longimicrobiaceae bacterium]